MKDETRREKQEASLEAPVYSRMEEKRKSRKHEMRSWLLLILITVMVGLCLRTFVFEIIRVEGPSMEPTLYTDYQVFVDKISYKFGAPNRGDIVICHYDGRDGTYVKRVIGLPGETISVKDGRVWIDGEVYDDPYFIGSIGYSMDAVLVPDNAVFVMGDNRNSSSDSHLSSVGPIDNNQIVGCVRLVIWPFNQIKIVGR